MSYLLRTVFAAALLLAGAQGGAAAAVSPAQPAGLALAGSLLPVDWQAGAVPVSYVSHFVLPDLDPAETPIVSMPLRGALDAGMTTGAVRAARPEALRKPAEGLFGSVALSFRKLPAAARMRALEAELNDPFACAGERCLARAGLVADFVGKPRDPRELIERVNRAVNGLVSYRSDRDGYGTVDHWAGPRETLARGYGDCEDFAMLKMAVLASRGIDPRDMSLVVLRDRSRQVYHAVLAVRIDGKNLVLDNLDRAVRRDTELAHYQPLFSVSAGKGSIHGWRTGRAPVAMASLRTLGAIAPGEGFATPVEEPASSAR